MVNSGMRRNDKPVLGYRAPSPKVTLWAVFGLFLCLAIPVFCLLSVIDWFVL